MTRTMARTVTAASASTALSARVLSRVLRAYGSAAASSIRDAALTQRASVVGLSILSYVRRDFTVKPGDLAIAEHISRLVEVEHWDLPVKAAPIVNATPIESLSAFVVAPPLLGIVGGDVPKLTDMYAGDVRLLGFDLSKRFTDLIGVTFSFHSVPPGFTFNNMAVSGTTVFIDVSCSVPGRYSIHCTPTALSGEVNTVSAPLRVLP
jgi:hypothetical protein